MWRLWESPWPNNIIIHWPLTEVCDKARRPGAMGHLCAECWVILRRTVAGNWRRGTGRGRVPADKIHSPLNRRA